MTFRYVSLICFGILIIIVITCNIIIFIHATSRYVYGTRYKEQVVAKTNSPYCTSTNLSDNLYLKWIFDNTRAYIRYELSRYNVSLYSEGVQYELKDLVMESGGRPLQSIIISTWKSGTTFLGELLNSVPGTYYHYEPLLSFGNIQIRGPPIADQALSTIKAMLKCNYEGLEDYFEYGSTHLNQFSHNTRLWKHCKHIKELCHNAEFTSRLCKLFPFQTMKVVRLRLKLIDEVLHDKQLNVRVILMIRDPRGVMQSRKRFCPPSPDCRDVSRVCADMISDYEAAGRILQQYPNSLKVLRFEELALKPKITGQRILKFLRLNATQSIDKYLQFHTNKTKDVLGSTFRVSRNMPFKWKKALDFNYVDQIQMVCKEAMHLWGYKMAHNKTHMKSKDFNPIDSKFNLTNKL